MALPSTSSRIAVRTLWNPYLPAAPGLMCSAPCRRSYITFRMCEWPVMTMPRRHDSGIAADVRHQYGVFLACETRRFRPYPSCLGVVYVAVNGPERFDGRDFVGERSRTDVARMPYLVHIRKEPLQGSIENSVRVRYDSYLFHPCKDKPAGRLPYPCGRFFTVPFFRREQFGRPVPVGMIRFTCLIIHIRHVICSV